eukprot:tig00021572_g22410.t1
MGRRVSGGLALGALLLLLSACLALAQVPADAPAEAPRPILDAELSVEIPASPAAYDLFATGARVFGIDDACTNKQPANNYTTAGGQGIDRPQAGLKMRRVNRVVIKGRSNAGPAPGSAPAGQPQPTPAPAPAQQQQQQQQQQPPQQKRGLLQTPAPQQQAAGASPPPPVNQELPMCFGILRLLTAFPNCSYDGTIVLEYFSHFAGSFRLDLNLTVPHPDGNPRNMPADKSPFTVNVKPGPTDARAGFTARGIDVQFTG